MSAGAPRVSVVMAVYNGARHLREAIDSILSQTSVDFEFLIVDDASTDETPAILAEYARNDKRIVLSRNKTNLGLTKTLNRALEITRAPLIARMDADDISEPDRFEKQVSFLDRHPHHLLVASGYKAINEAGRTKFVKRKPATHGRIRWWLRFRMPIEHPSVMFRSRTSDGAPVRYDESYRLAQDYALFAKLSEAGKLAILPDILFRYRVHPSNLSATRRAEQKTNSLRVAMRVQERDLPPSVKDDLRQMMLCYQLRDRATTSALRRAVRAFDAMLANDESRGIATRSWLKRNSAEVLADAFLNYGGGLRNPAFCISFPIIARRYMLALVMRYLENKSLLPVIFEEFPEDVGA